MDAGAAGPVVLIQPSSAGVAAGERRPERGVGSRRVLKWFIRRGSLRLLCSRQTPLEWSRKRGPPSNTEATWSDSEQAEPGEWALGAPVLLGNTGRQNGRWQHSPWKTLLAPKPATYPWQQGQKWSHGQKRVQRELGTKQFRLTLLLDTA